MYCEIEIYIHKYITYVLRSPRRLSENLTGCPKFCDHASNFFSFGHVIPRKLFGGPRQRAFIKSPSLPVLCFIGFGYLFTRYLILPEGVIAYIQHGLAVRPSFVVADFFLSPAVAATASPSNTEFPV
jgi:hypothetical protein